MTTEIHMGSFKQGLLARHTYSVEFTDAAAVSGPAVIVYNRAGADKTATVMPSGSPSASVNVVTLPQMRDLDEDDGNYRVVLTATADGQLISRVFDVIPKNEITL